MANNGGLVRSKLSKMQLGSLRGLYIHVHVDVFAEVPR